MHRGGHTIEVTGAAPQDVSGFEAFEALAVDDLTLHGRPGLVTGFLGPNGAGKTTTLRCLLGLVAPTAGDGAHRSGGPTETSSTRCARSGPPWRPRASTRAGRRGTTSRSSPRRPTCPRPACDECSPWSASRSSPTAGSAGSRSACGSAWRWPRPCSATRPVLVLDEPANGLDPAGIAWLRGFLRALAAEGRTVLVSSHVLARSQQTVDEVVVIARGRLVARRARLAELERRPRPSVLVRSPHRDRLAAALRESRPGASPCETAPDGHARRRGWTHRRGRHARPRVRGRSCTSWRTSPGTSSGCSSS